MTNRFNEHLDEARAKQKRFYIAVSITMLGSFLLLLLLFMVFNGTRIEVLPEEAAEDARVELERGFGFSLGATVYSLSSVPEIRVAAPGFETRVLTIGPEYLGKVFPVKLFQLPGHLIIETSSKNPRTQWSIDGRQVMVANRFDKKLEAGEYTITINDPFFQPKVLAVTLERQQQRHLQVVLEPLFGWLNLSSWPLGAEVFIDGKKVGVTPLRLDKKGGEYAVRVRAENYQDTLEKIQISQSETGVTRNYRLERKKAHISLELEPPGGDLSLDGIGVDGASPLKVDAMVEHCLTYSKHGYSSETKTLRLVPDEEREVSFRLEAKIGRVEISSSPAAAVWIHGKNHGQTPLTLRLPAFPHQITLKKTGYRTISKTITPSPRSTRKISVRLRTERETRLQRARGEYTNKAGGKLKLFFPNEKWVMGAARHEKGQRANEFLRTVQLTKPFYAGLFEVTNAEFRQFDPAKASGGADHPITSITWERAAAFCNWISRKEHLHPFYNIENGQVIGFHESADGYRLLSEAEWEWLARKAGKRKKTTFSWGNEPIVPPGAANVADESANGQVAFYIPNYTDGYPDIAPVGRFSKEKSGLYDLGGNVSEWVHDFYSIVPPTAGQTKKDPLGAQQGHAHVVKGANWRSGTITELRPAFREGLVGGRDDLGFRIGRYL